MHKDIKQTKNDILFKIALNCRNFPIIVQFRNRQEYKITKTHAENKLIIFQLEKKVKTCLTI